MPQNLNYVCLDEGQAPAEKACYAGCADDFAMTHTADLHRHLDNALDSTLLAERGTKCAWLQLLLMRKHSDAKSWWVDCQRCC